MRDLISRKDAILMIQRHGVGCFNADEFCPEEAERFVIGMLEKLPSAEPEQKTGKWVQISPAKIYECSECGQNVMTDDIGCYKYCHGCGAKMEGRTDE